MSDPITEALSKLKAREKELASELIDIHKSIESLEKILERKPHRVFNQRTSKKLECLMFTKGYDVPGCKGTFTALRKDAKFCSRQCISQHDYLMNPGRRPKDWKEPNKLSKVNKPVTLVRGDQLSAKKDH